MSMLFKRIKDWATSITAFRTGDVIPVDGPSGTAKMSKDSLLARAAESALAGNIVSVFDPARDEDNKYKVFEMCLHNGRSYMFTHDHYGAWNSADAQELPVSDSLYSVLKEITKGKFVDSFNSFTELTSCMLSSLGTTFDGCKTSISGWSCYYKSVNPGEIYHIKATCGQLARLWFFFDADGNKVAQYTDDVDPNTQKQRESVIVIPAGVCTLGTNRRWSGDSVYDPFIIEKYTEELAISALDVGNDYFVSSRNGALKRNTFSKEIGLTAFYSVDNSSWTLVNGKFLSSLGTSISTCEQSSSGWRYYYKSVSADEIYDLDSFCGQLARLWFFFDADGNKVAQYTDDVDPNTQKRRTAVVTIPEGVTTLAVNCGKEDGVFYNPTFKVRILQIPYNHISGVPEVIVPGDKMYGKTLVVCGDSITYGAAIGDGGTTDESPIRVFQRPSSGGAFAETTTGFIKNYGFDIACRHNMLYYNDGISGSTMQNIDTKHPFSAQNGRYTTLPNNLDYLVIFFGWNDTAYGSLGTIDDANNESYFGGYNVVMPYLINKYPYAKICLVVPYGTDEGHRNAIRSLANKWGVSVFDMYGPGTPLFYGKEPTVGVDASLIAPNKAKFTSDGTHPNVYGHKQIADMLEQHLMGI